MNRKIISEPVALTTMDIRIKNMVKASEQVGWMPHWRVRRFENKKDHQAQLRADLDGEVIELYTPRESLDLFGMPQITTFDGNALLNEGINEMWKLIAGGTATAFNNGNSYIGVGDSSTGENATHTDLQASTNKLYKAMDTSYPTYGTSQKITFKSTYGSSDANWAWAEFTVANGSSGSAVNMHRKVSAQGTKSSGQTWEVTDEITMS